MCITFSVERVLYTLPIRCNFEVDTSGVHDLTRTDPC